MTHCSSSWLLVILGHSGLGYSGSGPFWVWVILGEGYLGFRLFWVWVILSQNHPWLGYSGSGSFCVRAILGLGYSQSGSFWVRVIAGLSQLVSRLFSALVNLWQIMLKAKKTFINISKIFYTHEEKNESVCTREIKTYLLPWALGQNPYWTREVCYPQLSWFYVMQTVWVV